MVIINSNVKKKSTVTGTLITTKEYISLSDKSLEKDHSESVAPNDRLSATTSILTMRRTFVRGTAHGSPVSVLCTSGSPTRLLRPHLLFGIRKHTVAKPLCNDLSLMYSTPRSIPRTS